jgi:hypothetical protein
MAAAAASSARKDRNSGFLLGFGKFKEKEKTQGVI